MRLLLTLSANRTSVEFNHLHILAGALHKWLGPNEEHNGLSLYSYSWLQGGHANARGLHFPKGAQWHISAIDGDFLARSIQGIFRDPGIRWGMQVEQCQIVAPPPFPDTGEVRFLCASPVFVKRTLPDGEEKHYLYTDPESDLLLTETLRHKLRVAGLPDTGVSVRFDREYPKAKTQKVMYRAIGNMANYCPVFVRGTAEQLAFAWTVGVGNSTGVGMGAVYVDGNQKNNLNSISRDKKKINQQKKWTESEEFELPHLYLSLQLSYPELAKRFSCSVAEVRRKVREMGIEQ